MRSMVSRTSPWSGARTAAPTLMLYASCLPFPVIRRVAGALPIIGVWLGGWRAGSRLNYGAGLPAWFCGAGPPLEALGTPWWVLRKELRRGTIEPFVH